MHSAETPSLKAPASESERRGRVLPPPSPLKHAPCTMMNTTLPTDPNPTRVQELTARQSRNEQLVWMSAGNNLPTDTEVLFFALQIVQRAETAAEAKVWAQEVLRFQRRQHRGRRLAAARRGRVARQGTEAGAALRANGEGVQERLGVLGARVDLTTEGLRRARARFRQPG